MANDIELEDLSEQRRRARDQKDSRAEQLDPVSDAIHDNTVSSWAWVSAAILSLAGLTLLAFPRFVLFLSVSTENAGRSLTPLESFLSVQLAFLQLVLALALVLCIPSDDPVEQSCPSRSKGHPLLGPLVTISLLSSFVSYNSSLVGSLSTVFCIICGVIGLWGVWVVLFGGTSSLSEKTGADKHTSALFFGNKSAASSRKKEWLKAQKTN